jgi:hypothetical protein
MISDIIMLLILAQKFVVFAQHADCQHCANAFLQPAAVRSLAAV